jgi:hypothetical protein
MRRVKSLLSLALPCPLLVSSKQTVPEPAVPTNLQDRLINLQSDTRTWYYSMPNPMDWPDPLTIRYRESGV